MVSILKEGDRYVGIDIHEQQPNDGEWVKMKIKPGEPEYNDKEFLFCKVTKIFKGDVDRVLVDEDEYEVLIEKPIRQYVLKNNELIYDKWNFKQYIVLGDIINWKPITEEEYTEVSHAFENAISDGTQPEPVIQPNPITDMPIQGGRRKSRRKSKRNSKRKFRRSRR